MGNGTARGLLGLVLLGWGIVFLPGVTLAFDAAGNFSTGSNPNGTWSYGYSYGVGSTFILDTTNTTSYAGLALAGWMGNLNPAFGANYPIAVKNFTSHPVANNNTTVLQPGQLGLQPDASNVVSIVRWTAPFSGAFNINATFSGCDVLGDSVDVHVLYNGSSLFDSVVSPSPASYTGSQSILVGDTIDFAVGNGGNGLNDDTTGLAATIRPVVVGNADLGVSAIVTPGSTVTSSNVIYTIVITNRGPDNAVEVTITNTLAPQVIFLGCDAGTNGSCGAAGPGQIIGSYSFLATNDTGTLIITGQVLCTAVNRAVLTNTATVSAFTDDPVGADNQVSTVATNSNPLRKPLCSNTLSFTEFSQDRLTCDREEGSIFCREIMGDNLKISITIPLTGVDITQFNQNTFFDLTVGDFSFDDNLGDDPHYSPGKTQATFSSRVFNDDDQMVGHQTVQLKWTAEQLTATINVNDLDTLNSEITPALAGRYDGHATGPVTDVITASVDLGDAGTSFDVVPVTGSVLTGTGIGPDGMSYTLSAVRLKGTGSH
jgi:uncharacterized repeat protein (TIGR01451 family)